MSVVKKIASSPRITDQGLINLINKSPELTSAFGEQVAEDWIVEIAADLDRKIIPMPEQK